MGAQWHGIRMRWEMNIEATPSAHEENGKPRNNMTDQRTKQEQEKVIEHEHSTQLIHTQ
jgi:hypothetical protein